MPEPTRSFLTWSVRETAEATGLPVKSIYALIYKGMIPSFRIGRSRRIAPADLERFLASCREETQDN